MVDTPTYPAFTAIAAVVFLHERPTVVQRIGIVLALSAAVLLVVWPGSRPQDCTPIRPHRATHKCRSRAISEAGWGAALCTWSDAAWAARSADS
jgi:drug/metabolite transporter (DMT)-like permease